MGERHVALIVEDDQHIADIEKELVTSLGHEWRHATTLEEVRAAIATGGYCYVLLDLQIPANAFTQAAVGCGETALQLLRRAAPGRTKDGKHCLPILVITSYSRDLEYANKIFDLDANGYIAKPFGPRIDLILDKIRAILARAEREDHSACLAAAASDASPLARSIHPTPLPPPAPTATHAPPIRIRVDGTGSAGRTFVFVNETRVALQESYFGVFLTMTAFHMRLPAEWWPAQKLGIAAREWAASRVRTAFKGAVPAGFKMVESRKGTGFRLNPNVIVDHVEWAALLQHGQASVRKLATEWTRQTGLKA